MRTVKAKIVVDQTWLADFLSNNRSPRTQLVYPEAIEESTSTDKEYIIDILEQVYQQDLEQQSV